MIVFGNLYHLKPVMDDISWIFTIPRVGIQYISANLWQDQLSIFELEEIMRQKDYKSFTQLLNRLEEGNHMIPQDIQILQSRLLTEPNVIHPPDLDLIPYLFTTLAECDLHNFHVLTKLLDAMKAVVHSIDSVSGDVPCSLKEKKYCTKCQMMQGKQWDFKRISILILDPNMNCAEM